MITQGSEFQFFSDLVHHFFVVGAVRIRIIQQSVIISNSFPVLNHAPADQFQFRIGTRKIQVLTAKQKRRASRSDMDLFGAVLIQKFRAFPQLGSPHNGIIDQHHALVLNQCVNRYQLHPGNQVPLGLIGRHKGARPGRRIFDERTSKWNPGPVGISNRMGNTGVRHACHHISAHLISSCQLFSAAVAHLLYVDSLISRGWVSIINPQERTDVHFFSRFFNDFYPFWGNKVNFSRS